MTTTKEIEDTVAEMEIVRVFDAPRELVYQAWLDPEHLANWYGPQNFGVARTDIEQKPGGTYLIVMQGPDGKEYPNQGVINEMVENEKLVMTQIDNDEDGNTALEMVNTITFEEEDGKTRMTLHVAVLKASPQHLEMLPYAEAGWKAAFEKMAAYFTK